MKIVTLNKKNILYILILMVYFPLEKFTKYPSHYLIIPILTVFIIDKIKINKKYILNYEIYFFIFFIISTSRSFFSKYTLESVTLIIGFVIILLYYLYICYYLEIKKIEYIEKIIKKIIIIFLIVNYFFILTKYGKINDRGLERITGVFNDPNLFCLAIIIPIGYYSLDKKTHLENLIFYSSIVLFFKTLSRGGIIGLIFLFLVNFIQNRKKNKKYMKNILLLLFLMVIIFYFFKSEILKYIDFNKFYSRVADFNFINIKNKNELGSGRLGLWLSGIELLKKNLFFGVGMNNIPELLFELKGDYHYLHNTFLEVLVENGIIGGIFYFLFLFSFINQKNYSLKAKKIKNIIYAQLIMCMFLTSLLSIQIFFTFALYKYFNIIRNDEYN